MRYKIGAPLLTQIGRPYIRSIDGAKNMPKSKPFIVAANHSSYLDIFIVGHIIMSQTHRMFSGLYNSRYNENFFLRKILERYEAIPVAVGKDIRDRKLRQKSNKLAFERALNIIKKNGNILIFPEGGRSNTGKIRRGRPGVAKLALISHAPVIPIGIRGTYKILPKGALFPKFKRAEIFIGKPMHFKKYYNKKITRKLLAEITGQVMREIARLSGQRYQ